jgi:hypothetical protein
VTFSVGPGRPDGGYGRGFVSASEIAGYVSDPEALCRWAWTVTKAGRNPFYERDRDALTGALVHQALVRWLAGDSTAAWHLDGAEDVDGARMAFESGREWLSAELADGWVPESAEIPLRSERLRLAGTYDLTMVRAAERRLYDFKSRTETTNAGKVRDSMARSSDLFQLGLYTLLLDEHDKPPTGALVLCCPRTGGQAVATGFSADEMPMARKQARRLLALAHGSKAWERTKVARPLARIDETDDTEDSAIDFADM